MEMKKMIKCTAPIFITTLIILTVSPSISALANETSEINEGINATEKTIETEELVVEEISKDEYQVLDKETDETTSIEFSKDHTQSTITNPDGTIDTMIKKDNLIYLNGEVIGEEVKEESSPLLRATYKYVTTFKTKMSLKKTSASIAVSLAGLLGGPVGVFSTIAGILLTLKSYAPSKEVYIKIKQYYNSYAREIKNDYSMYKNSNYTGLLKSFTHKYRPYG
ncbi:MULTISPECIES: hypothetical protein [Listeria]|nr:MULTISPECIES: hypothetical protein [Listeria]EBF5152415.1 hypothetical protein [Listeria monocytogenes]EHK4067831.1 hypothetical protein [Listeria monocytogenes]MBC1904744.1 hypothetical protein [Listeria innocua]MBC2137579.1 hypothetical protein [Listeria innocua]TYV31575.1 hypothetical protein FZ060_15275 [Listeria monocytogenes]